MIPGIKAVHAIITPVCRQNKGVEGALIEALSRLVNEYNICCKIAENKDAKYHFVLTVERE